MSSGSLPEIAGFLARLGQAAAPFRFRAEHPLDAGGRDDQLLAKPGMGVDEGVMVVGDEMARVTALAKRRSFFQS